MSLSLTIIIIAISLIPLKVALFETAFALVLCTPVLAFLIGKYSSLTSVTYMIAFALLYAAAIAVSYRNRNNRTFDLKEEILPIGLFVAALGFVYSLTQQWPDFIAMGERLRDFAILSSVIQSPVDVQEPWMSGATLNYYAFWYRFGHFLSSLFSLKTWDVYNLLQSFTYALYFTTAYRLLSKYFQVHKGLSVLFAFFICFGSNLAGIKDFVFSEPGWWGPSRVIPGAINEFPAWSLLLGDLHPHYLNLPLIPFFAVFFAYLYSSTKNALNYGLIVLGGLVVGTLWISNANIWEKPVWWLLGAVALTYFLIELFKETYFAEKGEAKEFNIKFDLTFFISLLVIASLSISLYISKENIVAPDYPISLVKGTIPRTTLHDFSLHFGIPLFIILAASIFQIQGTLLKVTSCLLGFYFFFFNDVLPLLILLVVINLLRINKEHSIFSRVKSTMSFKNWMAETFCIFSLILLMVPELIFVDDPYGSEIERMNTIFKIYSAAWFFIHVSAFYYLAGCMQSVFAYCRNRSSKQLRITAYTLVLVFLLAPATIYGIGFFFITIDERAMKDKSIKPVERGLSEINKVHPGSADTIITLSELPKGVVLEAQGKPYDYTTMIATLSEQRSYVGWTNHLNLLLSNNPEITRREKLSDEFYNSPDCNKKSSIMKSEGINYVIFGPLEKARHPQANVVSFSCLKLVKQNSTFAIYSN